MALTSTEREWARQVGRAMVPAGVMGGVVDDVDLGERFAAEYAESPWYAALLLRLSLWLTWFAPVWLNRRLRTFGGLDGEARVAVLEALLVHPRYEVRLAGMFLKLNVCILLFGERRVLARLGAYRLDEAASSSEKRAS